jgi:hypothetical protein
MRLLLVAALAAAHCFAALPVRATAAETAPAAALEAVSTLDVEGTIEVDAAGAVTTLALTTALPAPMGANLEARVRQWKFAPVLVDGVAQPAKGRLRVALSARKQDGSFQVQVDNASVTGIETSAGPLAAAPARVKTLDATPPKYPSSVLRKAVVPARVLVAVRLGDDGRVAEAAVLQGTLLDASEVTRHASAVLAEFERVALKATREWRFEVAPGDAPPTPAELTQYLPVTFGTPDAAPAQAGAWRPVVRSPRAVAPWLAAGRPVGVSDDARQLYVSGTREPFALLDDVAGTRL